MPDRATCETCRFWEGPIEIPGPDADTIGVCRRAPPGFDDRTEIAVWPLTQDTDWCGEHRAQPAIRLDQGAMQ